MTPRTHRDEGETARLARPCSVGALWYGRLELHGVISPRVCESKIVIFLER